jgi:UDP-N-acetylmuramoyl-L-alanyl-D-glutamate--2,6-diaminopimelate ligase
VEYDIAVITNITSEHLEVHGTLENYRRAKAMLCEAIDPTHSKLLPFAVPRVCVLNADDATYAYVESFCHAPVLAYGIDNPRADIQASDLRLGPSSTQFEVRLPDGDRLNLRTPLVGRFNVSNCLAALTVGYAHGLSGTLLVEALAHAPRIPGRMERIEAGQPFTVVVDYAHTADSLEKVLQTLRPLTSGQLIVVFGSAGDRDRAKRPVMGSVAARLADFAVITDEDPREEDAAAVLREIARGAEAAGARAGEHFVEVVDRRTGIAVAFARARAGDTVLLAGKGHEQSIIVGTDKRPWDDPTVARELLAQQGYAGYPPHDASGG